MNDLEKFDQRSPEIRKAVRLHLQKHRYIIGQSPNAVLVSEGNLRAGEQNTYDDHFSAVSYKIDEVDLRIESTAQLNAQLEPALKEAIDKLGVAIKKEVADNLTDSNFQMYSSRS